MSASAPRAVFLSYASQDTPVVAALAAALRAEGIEVWFDQDELRGGEAWDAKIKKQIRECALFVPVISENTQARPEGYFRLEWHLAEQRSLLIARGRPFVVPVCLDATTEGDALVPEAFLAVQWTRLPQGKNAPAFVAQVKRLLSGGTSPVASGSAAMRSGSVAPAGQSPALADAPAISDYELLRQIGRGAYGDVWLARGLTGAYRAIKIVWRDRFDDPAPYHREFRGVKEAMGISLEPGQLPLLHIGQDEKAGYFYYVMELADDVKAGRTVDPATYAPLTLKELRARHGRLPATQCLEFAEILAQAIAALHVRGLVHRDIKPSNVVIVRGRPTLADIGLLATAGNAHTYVGTQGYLAPEGPGSPVADVFALGRLLYELATGFDREEFPRLPADIADPRERAALFALNEILLRAGEPLAQNRYRDATVMLADLRARQSRAVRRQRQAWALAAVAATAIAVAAGIRWWPHPAASPAPGTPSVVPAATAFPAAPDKSIAVMSFENLSGDKENDYFASCLQEDVLTNLAEIRTLKVVPRDSAKRYHGTTKSLQQVGTELGARYILTGSLRREARTTLLNAQLIDTRTDTQVWAKRFEREPSQVLTLQTALAEEIITAIRPTLTPGEKALAAREVTSSAAAYDLYLQERKMRQEGFAPEGIKAGALRAENLLRQAVALDPGFVRAWVELADLHKYQYWDWTLDVTDTRIALAEQAIAEAHRLAPDAPEVLVGMGQIRHYMYKDYDGAAALYRQALATHPNYPGAHAKLAFLYRRLGRWVEAVAEFREAWRCEPGNVYKATPIHELLMWGRRFSEAEAVKQDILRYWPDNRETTFWMANAGFETSGSDAEFKHWLAGIPAEERESPEIVDARIGWGLATGDEPMLLDLIRRHGLSLAQIDAAALLLYRGEHELLAQQLAKMKPEVDQRLKETPLSALAWIAAAKYHALDGNRTEALAALNRSQQVTDEGNVWVAADCAANRATVLAWLGEKDAAIAEIARLINRPKGVPVGDLKYGIYWMGIRDDPRVQALIADPKNREPLF